MKKMAIMILTLCMTAAAILQGCGSKADAAASGTEGKVYESRDGWRITYDPSKFALNEDSENGEVCFNYIGKCSGTTAVTISYVPGKMPDEALYEKVAGIDDSRIARGEASFGMDSYWSHYRYIKPENTDPEAGDVVYEGFTGIEHNGGTVIIDSISHAETDDEIYNAVIQAESELLNTFELLDHEPQTEYAYMVGTYVQSDDGNAADGKGMVVLNEDHSCELTFQDTVYGEWTGTELSMNDGSSYEFTVEGDGLYLNMDGQWLTFTRKQ